MLLFINVGQALSAALHNESERRQISADDFSGRDHRIRTRALQHEIQKIAHFFKLYVHRAVMSGKQRRHTGKKRQQLIVGKARKAHDRSEHLTRSRDRGGILSEHIIHESGTERLIAEQSASGVLQKLGRTRKNDLQSLRLSLQGIVKDREYFFVIVFTGNAVGNLIEVHAFVNEDHQTAVADLSGEGCE